jgi:PatG C-terminal
MSDLSSPAIPADGAPATVKPTDPAMARDQPTMDSDMNCPTCGGDVGASAPSSYIYAIGRIEARFPQLSIEKEFAQVTGRAETQGLTDRQALHQVLSRAENRYLARQLCWVMTIGGLDTYILIPRDPADVQLLIDAIRPTPTPMDIDVVIGARGPIAPPTLCNGLMVPIVAFDQIYSFDVETLIRAIPRPADIEHDQFRAVAEEVFNRVAQVGDNVGATDKDRALNYLIMRYPAVYAAVAEEHAKNAFLSGVDVLPSNLSGTRRIVEVVVSFTHRVTDVVEKRFVRVDVTEKFPFLVTKLSPYYDR